VPLDLVEAFELDQVLARTRALEGRVRELSRALRTVVDRNDWAAARAIGRDALALEVPPARGPAAVIAAWGCPECGRIDAPQPCLDVCIRRPVEVADAEEYRRGTARELALAERERELTDAVRLLVHVSPRPGHEATTEAELTTRVRVALRLGPHDASGPE
jgi:hypothetical protein